MLAEILWRSAPTLRRSGSCKAARRSSCTRSAPPPCPQETSQKHMPTGQSLLSLLCHATLAICRLLHPYCWQRICSASHALYLLFCWQRPWCASKKAMTCRWLCLMPCQECAAVQCRIDHKTVLWRLSTSALASPHPVFKLNCSQQGNLELTGIWLLPHHFTHPYIL